MIDSILLFKDHLDKLDGVVAQKHLEMLRTSDLSLQELTLIKDELLANILRNPYKNKLIDAWLSILDHRVSQGTFSLSALYLFREVRELRNGYIPYMLFLRGALSSNEYHTAFKNVDLNERNAGLLKLLKQLTGLAGDNQLRDSLLWIMLRYLIEFHPKKDLLQDEDSEHPNLLVAVKEGLEINRTSAPDITTPEAGSSSQPLLTIDQNEAQDGFNVKSLLIGYCTRTFLLNRT